MLCGVSGVPHSAGFLLGGFHVPFGAHPALLGTRAWAQLCHWVA